MVHSDLHRGPEIGAGIYTMPDIGQILRIPYQKVQRWVKDYWDTKLAKDFGQSYSWHDGKSRAIDFHTLIELVVFSQFREAGVKPKEILKAHKELSVIFNSPFPFATSKVLKSIFTDGNTIFFKEGSDAIVSLDGKRQFNFKFIELFFKNIDFGDDDLASRFWPLGKKKSVVVDPHHQCGQPVIDGTNIVPDAIYNLYKAGDKADYIAYLYEIDVKKVKDAVEFCKTAA